MPDSTHFDEHYASKEPRFAATEDAAPRAPRVSVTVDTEKEMAQRIIALIGGEVAYLAILLKQFLEMQKLPADDIYSDRKSFFQQYEHPVLAGLSAASLVTTPTAFALGIGVALCGAVFGVIRALIGLVTLDGEGIKEGAFYLALGLGATLVFAAMIVPSFVINLVGLVGRGFATLFAMNSAETNPDLRPTCMGEGPTSPDAPVPGNGPVFAGPNAFPGGEEPCVFTGEWPEVPPVQAQPAQPGVGRNVNGFYFGPAIPEGPEPYDGPDYAFRN